MRPAFFIGSRVDKVEILSSRGSVHSGVNYQTASDIKVSLIPQRRMKCPFCKTTWTLRAEGVTEGKQRTDRLIAIGVVFGRGICALLKAGRTYCVLRIAYVSKMSWQIRAGQGSRGFVISFCEH